MRHFGKNIVGHFPEERHTSLYELRDAVRALEDPTEHRPTKPKTNHHPTTSCRLFVISSSSNIRLLITGLVSWGKKEKRGFQCSFGKCVYMAEKSTSSKHKNFFFSNWLVFIKRIYFHNFQVANFYGLWKCSFCVVRWGTNDSNPAAVSWQRQQMENKGLGVLLFMKQKERDVGRQIRFTILVHTCWMY